MTSFLRRLLFTLTLVAGADLVLFLSLDSGLLGDPALLEVGPRGSAADVGYARWRLGHYRGFKAEALHLRLVSQTGPMEMRLVVEGEDLQVLREDQAIATLSAQGDLGQLASEITRLASPDGAWRLDAFVADEHRSLPASGVAHALAGLPLTLQDGQNTAAPWADVAPQWSRFLHGFGALLRFDFGLDRQGRPVIERLRDRGGRSLLLSLPAFLLTTLCAVALSLWAGARPKVNRNLQVVAVLVMSVTSIAWILLLRHMFAVEAEWFPLRPWGDPVWPLLALPILIWVWLSTWPDFLLYRTLVEERKAQTWMTAARARGYSGSRIWWRHMMPSLLAPIAALLCVTLPFLVLGSLLIETIFDIPGLGSTLMDAVAEHDTNLLRALTFLIALGFLGAQWLGDGIARQTDPRLRSMSR
ncbi:MAG: ABC transporter permease subunit [Planctomycetota bacterium]|jgi:ABC-type dipeptide/oligopeptide/nickel transport system permease component